MNGSRWREWRLRKKLSTRKFAKLIEVSPSYVCSVESGKEPHGYTRHKAMLAARVLELNAEESRDALSIWRAYHNSEVLAIDEFVKSVAPLPPYIEREVPE